MSDNADQLLEIERQGAEFVRALIPHLPHSLYRNKAAIMWDVAIRWVGYQPSPRKSPAIWRSYFDGEVETYRFCAGAETAIREYEATL